MEGINNGVWAGRRKRLAERLRRHASLEERAGSAGIGAELRGCAKTLDVGHDPYIFTARNARSSGGRNKRGRKGINRGSATRTQPA